jgi:hypothetical protein
MLVPLYGFLQGDVIGILVLAHAEHTLAEVAAQLAVSADVRVTPAAAPGRVRVAGRLLDGALTVAESGLAALDRFDVEPEALH